MGYEIEYVNDKNMYDEIKQKLTATDQKRPKKPEIFHSNADLDIPGPGYYGISDLRSTFYASRSTKFTKAERFLKTQRFPTKSQSISQTIEKKSPKTEESLFYSPRAPITSTTSIGIHVDLINTDSGLKSKNTTRYGSFSKAERKFMITQRDDDKVGPGSYNVTAYSPHNKTGFSFGGRTNSLVGRSLSPGPGTYAPEKVTITANHVSPKGPLIMKADSKTLALKTMLKQPPFGESYYQNSYYSSFNVKKSPKEKKTFGSASKLAPLKKSQLITPGPGAYNIADPLSTQLNNSKTDFKYHPSFGKPYSPRPWLKEELPGPGDYSIAESDRGKVKIKIGTSKRPGFFDPKKQAEIILNEEKLKRLKRLEKLEALKAEREKVRTNRPKHVSSRKLYFDVLVEKAEEGPGFSYDIAKYNQIGSSKGGGVIGKSERKFMKEIEEAKNTPGPGTYELSAIDLLKQQSEVKFPLSERPNIFVAKESYNIPGVGSYEVRTKFSSKGGAILSRKDLSEHKTEKVERIESIYEFFDTLDERIEEMMEKEKKKIQEGL